MLHKFGSDFSLADFWAIAIFNTHHILIYGFYLFACDAWNYSIFYAARQTSHYY